PAASSRRRAPSASAPSRAPSILTGEAESVTAAMSWCHSAPGGASLSRSLAAHRYRGREDLADLCAELGGCSRVSLAERRLKALGGDVERAHETLGERDDARRARTRLERIGAVGELGVAGRR